MATACLADLKGKIVEAVSVTGLGACQLQWHELQRNGIDFMNDPKQVCLACCPQHLPCDVFTYLSPSPPCPIPLAIHLHEASCG